MTEVHPLLSVHPGSPDSHICNDNWKPFIQEISTENNPIIQDLQINLKTPSTICNFFSLKKLKNYLFPSTSVSTFENHHKIDFEHNQYQNISMTVNDENVLILMENRKNRFFVFLKINISSKKVYKRKLRFYPRDVQVNEDFTILIHSSHTISFHYKIHDIKELNGKFLRDKKTCIFPDLLKHYYDRYNGSSIRKDGKYMVHILCDDPKLLKGEDANISMKFVNLESVGFKNEIMIQKPIQQKNLIFTQFNRDNRTISFASKENGLEVYDYEDKKYKTKVSFKECGIPLFFNNFNVCLTSLKNSLFSIKNDYSEIQQINYEKAELIIEIYPKNEKIVKQIKKEYKINKIEWYPNKPIILILLKPIENSEKTHLIFYCLEKFETLFTIKEQIDSISVSNKYLALMLECDMKFYLWDSIKNEIEENNKKNESLIKFLNMKEICDKDVVLYKLIALIFNSGKFEIWKNDCSGQAIYSSEKKKHIEADTIDIAYDGKYFAVLFKNNIKISDFGEKLFPIPNENINYKINQINQLKLLEKKNEDELRILIVGDKQLLILKIIEKSDLPNLIEIEHNFKFEDENLIKCFDIDFNEKKIIFAGTSINIWNLETETQIKDINPNKQEADKADITNVAFEYKSSDLFVTSDNLCRICYFSIKGIEGKLLKSLQFGNNETKIQKLDFSFNNEYLFCLINNEIRAYVYQTEYYVELAKDSVFAMNQKKDHIASASKKKLFNINMIRTIETKINCKNINLMTISHDNKQAALWGKIDDKDELIFYEIETGIRKKSLNIDENTNLHAMSFCECGEILLMFVNQYEFLIYNCKDDPSNISKIKFDQFKEKKYNKMFIWFVKKHLKEFQNNFQRVLSEMGLDPYKSVLDDLGVVLSTNKKKIQFMKTIKKPILKFEEKDLKDLTKLRKYKPDLDHESEVLGYVWSKDKRILASNTEKYIYIWDISTTTLRNKIPIQGSTKLFAFSNNSMYLSTNKGIITIKNFTIFTICLQNLKFLDQDDKKKKICINRDHLKNIYCICPELLEETINYGSIPGFDLSIIHYLSYRKKIDLLNLFKKIFFLDDFSFSIINGFNIDCFGKTPIDIALENKEQASFHEPLFEILLKKHVPVGCCPSINLQVLTKLSENENDSDLILKTIKSRLQKIEQIKEFVSFDDEINIFQNNFDFSKDKHRIKLKQSILIDCARLNLYKFQPYIQRNIYIFLDSSHFYLSGELSSRLPSYLRLFIWLKSAYDKFPYWIKLCLCIFSPFFGLILYVLTVVIAVVLESVLIVIDSLLFVFVETNLIIYCIHYFSAFFARILMFIQKYYDDDDKKKKRKKDVKILDIKDLFRIEKSNLFFEELSKKSPNHKIFEDFFIESIIDLKWRDGKIFHMRETFDFLTFLILFTLETIYMIPYRVHPVQELEFEASFVLSCVVLLFCLFSIFTEYMQIKDLGIKLYFRLVWNYLDGLVIFFTIPAYIFNLIDLISENGLDDNSIYAFKTILSLSTFVIYVKMLSYGRGFDNTSHFVRVLIQVIIDIRVFIFIFFFMILTISFSVFVLQNDDIQDKFGLYITIYTLILGDRSQFENLSSNIPWLLWVIYIFSTVYLTIIMLNLLISIIGDSYEQVISIERRTRNYEKLVLILYFEKKNRKKKMEEKLSNQYLFVAGPTDSLDNDDFMENNNNDNGMTRIRTRVDDIKKDVMKISNKIIDEKNISQRFDKIENLLSTYSSRFENIEKLLKENLGHKQKN